MANWPTRTLSDLFDIQKGKIGIKAATPGEYPLVTTGEAHQSHNEAHFSGDALCIPMISATGHGHASIKRLHHIEGRFSVGSILCACIAKDPKRISARYFYYYLTALKDELLTPLMQGSANVSLRMGDVASVEVPLPPINHQMEVVRKLDSLRSACLQLNEHLDRSDACGRELLQTRFQAATSAAPLKTMADIAPLVRREVQIEPNARYTELGIRSFFKGTFHRRVVSGSEFTWQRMYAVKEQDLIFSNIMAWEEAIALAGPQDNGCLGNHRMLTCVPDGTQILPEFLYYYFTTPEGFAKIYAASPGTAARNRTLMSGSLEEIRVPVPSLSVQKTFVDLFSSIDAMKQMHDTLRDSNSQLLPATLAQIFEDID